ncbi:MAG: hypothetical protein MMC23_006017 [Stictis urceolatum]|nr:hypothetical protein [Stictis urceolata]
MSDAPIESAPESNPPKSERPGGKRQNKKKNPGFLAMIEGRKKAGLTVGPRIGSLAPDSNDDAADAQPRHVSSGMNELNPQARSFSPSKDIFSPANDFVPINQPYGDSNPVTGAIYRPAMALAKGYVPPHRRANRPRWSPEPDKAGSVKHFRVVPPWCVDNIIRNAEPPNNVFELSLRSVAHFRAIPPWRIDKACSTKDTSAKAARRAAKAEKLEKESVEKGDKKRKTHPAPRVALDYLQQANAPPRKIAVPQKLLLVLDVNGTLGFRNNKSSSFRPRPYFKEFMKYCFEEHEVLIWSSAMPKNVEAICKRELTSEQKSRVLGVWGRDTLGLSASDFTENVQVYKRLETVWGNLAIQVSNPYLHAGAKWGQHNTVLIDDSAIKAAAQPYNHIEVPENVRFSNFDENSALILKQVQDYLETARRWFDVSSFIKHNKLVFEGADVAATVSDVDEEGGVPLN